MKLSFLILKDINSQIHYNIRKERNHMKQFCEILTDALAKKRITQKELAKHIGCGSSTISSYATGNSEPDFMTLCRICIFLEIDLTAVIVGINADHLTYQEHLLLKEIRNSGLSEDTISNLIQFIKGNRSNRT